MKVVPIMADFHDRSAVVIGAGKVATRRIRWLLDAGARVTVVGPPSPPHPSGSGRTQAC